MHTQRCVQRGKKLLHNHSHLLCQCLSSSRPPVFSNFSRLHAQIQASTGIQVEICNRYLIYMHPVSALQLHRGPGLCSGWRASLLSRHGWARFKNPTGGQCSRRSPPDLLHRRVPEIPAALWQLQCVLHRLHQDHWGEAPAVRRALLVHIVWQRVHLQGQLWGLVLHARRELPHADASGRRRWCERPGDQGFTGEWSQGASTNICVNVEFALLKLSKCHICENHYNSTWQLYVGGGGDLSLPFFNKYGQTFFIYLFNWNELLDWFAHCSTGMETRLKENLLSHYHHIKKWLFIFFIDNPVKCIIPVA